VHKRVIVAFVAPEVGYFMMRSVLAALLGGVVGLIVGALAR